MNRILMLWAVPRSTSTAFEWMMRMRGDLNCFHEPFGEAWYRGTDARWPRRCPDTPPVPGLSFASVRCRLESAVEQGSVFVKDFAHYVAHLWDEEFLSLFQHSFLVRDPAKVLTSLYTHWPEFGLEETGFREQRQLFDRLCERDGTIPPVIDSDDLLAHPNEVVAAYCKAVGIDFMADALSWDPGDCKEVSWYDKGSWHGNLRASTGLKPQSRPAVDMSTKPEWMQRMHDEVWPDYQQIYRYRLTGH